MFAYPNPYTETVYLKVTIFEAHVLLLGFASGFGDRLVSCGQKAYSCKR